MHPHIGQVENLLSGLFLLDFNLSGHELQSSSLSLYKSLGTYLLGSIKSYIAISHKFTLSKYKKKFNGFIIRISIIFTNNMSVKFYDSKNILEKGRHCA